VTSRKQTERSPETILAPGFVAFSEHVVVAVQGLDVVDLTEVVDHVPVVESGDDGSWERLPPGHFVDLCSIFRGHAGDAFAESLGHASAGVFAFVEGVELGHRGKLLVVVGEVRRVGGIDMTDVQIDTQGAFLKLFESGASGVEWLPGELVSGHFARRLKEHILGGAGHFDEVVHALDSTGYTA